MAPNSFTAVATTVAAPMTDNETPARETFALAGDRYTNAANTCSEQ